MQHHLNRESGFSLAEVLVAAGMLAGALATLAHLFVLGSRTTASARDITFATVLAAQKIEELRSTAWGVDEVGASFGAPPQAGTDYLDRSGRVMGTGSRPPAGATYFRRWSVEGLASNPGNTIMLRVRAGRWRSGAIGEAPDPDEAWLLAARTRKAR